MLFHNLARQKFDIVPAVEGAGLAAVIAGRGMAVGDLFNDGKIDAVINVMDGHPVLLRNVDPNHNHWIELKLIGGRKSSARCNRRRRLPHRRRNEAAGRRHQRRQLSLQQRPAPPLRPRRRNQDRRRGNPLARRQSRTRHQPPPSTTSPPSPNPQIDSFNRSRWVPQASILRPGRRMSLACHPRLPVPDPLLVPSQSKKKGQDHSDPGPHLYIQR